MPQMSSGSAPGRHTVRHLPQTESPDTATGTSDTGGCPHDSGTVRPAIDIHPVDDDWNSCMTDCAM